MFWGLAIEQFKRYGKVVDNAFHISAAVLDTLTADEDIVRLMVEVDGQETLIANLSKPLGLLQVPLDLQFMEGSRIAFFTSGGKGTVHMSGYLVPDMDDLEEMDGEEVEEEEEEDDEEVPVLVPINGKRKSKDIAMTAGKKAKLEVMEDSDDEEDDDDYELEEEEDLEEEEGEEEEEEEEVEEEEVVVPESTPKKVKATPDKPKPVAKSPAPAASDKPKPVAESPAPAASPGKSKKEKKKEKKAAKQAALAAAMNGTAKEEKSAKKQEEPAKKKEDPSKKQNGPAEIDTTKKLKGGVRIEDIVVGKGKKATTGNKVFMYYAGRLKNGKLFDKCTDGKGLSFLLGRGQVIQGWDIGVVGMLEGGKRKIICPPHMAYGPRGAPPDIPPNATLVFNVELRQVK